MANNPFRNAVGAVVIFFGILFVLSALHSHSSVVNKVHQVDPRGAPGIPRKKLDDPFSYLEFKVKNVTDGTLNL